MEINIKGDPGQGNTFQDIHIDHVDNFNPNATTVVNNYYGDKQKSVPAAEKVLQDAEREKRKADIMQYVAKLARYVSKDWKNRYETLWKNILALPEVEAEVYEPGKQKGTTFNRNLIANIICMMVSAEVFNTDNATHLTIALEGDKEHSVRNQLREYPQNDDIKEKINDLLY
uniref:hypothetical protein n=1 Tax=Prevotella sp. TaxID=59823 RepID=UPI003FF020C2